MVKLVVLMSSVSFAMGRSNLNSGLIYHTLQGDTTSVIYHTMQVDTNPTVVREKSHAVRSCKEMHPVQYFYRFFLYGDVFSKKSNM